MLMRPCDQRGSQVERTAKLSLGVIPPAVCNLESWRKIGDMGIRTPGLTGAIRALYQLSYIPAFFANYNPGSKKTSSQVPNSHFATIFVSN